MATPAGGSLNSPVVLIIFNRPETTERVFAEIARAKPRTLLVVADGPRADVSTDNARCAAARDVVEQVDWHCRVLKNYSNANLGCKRRIESGLDWAFGEVQQAIVLEDDCLPDSTFFPYCEELLERWRDDERVMAISGNNFQAGRRRGPASYYFSRYVHVWGWATWRRAWRHYDAAMAGWPAFRDERCLENIFRRRSSVRYWTTLLQATYEGRIDTWDYAWLMSCWMSGGLAVLPNVNLVMNIGFGAGATHTTGREGSVPTQPMEFPLRHPLHVTADARADGFTAQRVYRTRLSKRAKDRVVALRRELAQRIETRSCRGHALR